MVILSAVLITFALIFYSIGVWAEKIAKFLKPWHVLTFWVGFSFDISGTILMHLLAEGPFNIFDSHTLTGQLALWLMLAHAIWATGVVKKDNRKLREKFHRYSIIVWMFWLVPYFGGMIMAMK